MGRKRFRPSRLISGMGWGASSGSVLSHAAGLAFGDHDDGVVQEGVEHGQGGDVLGGKRRHCSNGQCEATARERRS
jgi:hypothetical protein